MSFEWFMDHIFFRLMGILCAGFVVFLVWLLAHLTLIPAESAPVPLDMCRNTQLHVVIQEHNVLQDYIDLRGNTIYLVWQLSALDAPKLTSKQVIPGDLCHS